MSRRVFVGVAFAAALTTPLALAGTAGASPAPSGSTHSSARVCAVATHGYAACSALVRVNAKGQPAVTSSPSGYGPADLQSAYALPSATAGSGQTIAIVDAYNDPSAEADLGVYRSQYGLSSCTTANGCFSKVDQNGGTAYPRNDSGWSQEISLDVDMASAICPNCKILLVEATTPSFANLGAAVNTAARLGAQAISNSYGGSDASDANYGQYYNHPGHAITVSSGDNGYGVEYPASSQYVTAVGGTHLIRASGTRGWAETAWSGAGSGCSAYNAKPSWQTDGGCAKRTVADVSAVADPATGVAVYDSYASKGTKGWLVFGGTSVSAPIIAGVYALAGNGSAVNYGSYPYSHTASLFDVVGGSNGSCSTAYLCNAVTGFDGPTGLGTPNGTGAF
ncbi:MAG: S53 family peptidase [Mycobacteriales bacterium]